MQEFCGVSTHHQTGVAERKIRTIMTLSLAMLFATMIKNPFVVTLAFWPCEVHHTVDDMSNTPNSSGFAP